MSDSTADYLVIGAGALGSAAAYWLARAGAGRVILCEQFAPGHAFGSSDDHSRIIRHAYHSSDYTALTPAMFDTWKQVEADSGVQLVVTTGGLDMAQADGSGVEILQKYRASLDAAGLHYDRLSASDIRSGWPQWHIPDDTVGMFQADAGLVDIRRATAVHTDLARRSGVEIRSGCQILDIREVATGVEVVTGDGVLSVGGVVVCAGSWVGDLLSRLGTDLTIELTQEQVQYFTVQRPEDFAPERFPVWIWHDEFDFYGFPVYGEVAVKAARDMTGRFVTQETRSFEPDDGETEIVRAFLAERLPGAIGPTLLAKTCVYDLPRDRELVIGPIPGHPAIQIAIGAGHAGKFASLIGRILADLATTGDTAYPIEPFSAGRSALRSDAPSRYRLGAELHTSARSERNS